MDKSNKTNNEKGSRQVKININSLVDSISGPVYCGTIITAYPISIFKDILRSLTDNSNSIINGIFLYTDEDEALANYVKKHINALDKLTGDWCNIYVLEKCDGRSNYDGELWPSFPYSRYCEELGLDEQRVTPKPFDRNESYNIARDLNVPFEAFPCLVLLSPLKETKLDGVSLASIKTEILGKDKLIVPIREVSVQYFRKMFSTLERIVKSAGEGDKYEAIKINFKAMIQYLEDNSEQVIRDTATEYHINGTQVLVGSEFRSVNLTENNNPINISESNIASVTDKGEIGTAIVHQHNYSAEQKQTLAEAAKEIQELLEQISKTSYSAIPDENLEIIGRKTVEEIGKNASLKSKIVNALKEGGTEAFKELIDHPAVNVVMAAFEGWQGAEGE